MAAKPRVSNEKPKRGCAAAALPPNEKVSVDCGARQDADEDVAALGGTAAV